ncbi:Hypothetical predicted protein [Octopus vulgaris]|uniref:HTH psq-type domain-containing protein n=1 Tax=Octopus vulgaris TaxID=6645 RepID=A0AA36B9F6_OCTVU|nr:Hypothetical predicted protein [Octopus vulgaris]
MTEQKEVKSLMEEYKWYDVGETRYAVIEKKNIGEFMGRCERENWEVKDIRMSDEFVENMDEYFGVRMDMEFIRIDKEHSSDYEKQRTGGIYGPPMGRGNIIRIVGYFRMDPHPMSFRSKTERINKLNEVRARGVNINSRRNLDPGFTFTKCGRPRSTIAMVRHYKRKSEKSILPQDVIKQAIQQVRTRVISLREASRTFGIPLKSLSRYCTKAAEANNNDQSLSG